MAQLRQSINIPTNYMDSNWREREKAELRRVSQILQEEKTGDLVGETLRWQRADGYAQYIIVSEKPFAIAHLVIGDAYSVEEALIRGLRLSDAREMVRRERGMKELFS
jgi:hypothetical protein